MSTLTFYSLRIVIVPEVGDEIAYVLDNVETLEEAEEAAARLCDDWEAQTGARPERLDP